MDPVPNMYYILDSRSCHEITDTNFFFKTISRAWSLRVGWSRCVTYKTGNRPCNQEFENLDATCVHNAKCDDGTVNERD